jgi:hypothetical protein
MAVSIVRRLQGRRLPSSWLDRPRPEERAPKSGLPDFGTLMVSKSATVDFDSRVSKDGHRQDRAGVHPSVRRALRTAPQDEVRGFEIPRRPI